MIPVEYRYRVPLDVAIVVDGLHLDASATHHDQIRRMVVANRVDVITLFLDLGVENHLARKGLRPRLRLVDIKFLKFSHARFAGTGEVIHPNHVRTRFSSDAQMPLFVEFVEVFEQVMTRPFLCPISWSSSSLAQSASPESDIWIHLRLTDISVILSPETAV